MTREIHITIFCRVGERKGPRPRAQEPYRVTRSVWVGIATSLLAQAAGLAMLLRTQSWSWTLLIEAVVFVCGTGILVPYLAPRGRMKAAATQTGSQATLASIFLAVATIAMLAVAVAIATDVERSARSTALGFLAELPIGAVGLSGYMLLSPRIVADDRHDAPRVLRSLPFVFALAALAMAISLGALLLIPHPSDHPFPHDVLDYLLAAGSALMIAGACESARRVRPLVS